MSPTISLGRDFAGTTLEELAQAAEVIAHNLVTILESKALKEDRAASWRQDGRSRCRRVCGSAKIVLVPVSRTLGFALGRNISSSRPDSLGAACRLIRGEALDLFFDQLLGEHRHDFPHHLLDDFA